MSLHSNNNVAAKSLCGIFGIQVGASEISQRPKVKKDHFEEASLHQVAGLLGMVPFINLDTTLSPCGLNYSSMHIGSSHQHQVSIFFVSGYFLIFPLDFFFDPWVFRGVLFNFYIFVNFPVSLLLLASSFITWYLEKVLDIILVF